MKIINSKDFFKNGRLEIELTQEELEKYQLKFGDDVDLKKNIRR